MELVKDYDIEILYNQGKANVVADALSRKVVHTSAMITKQKSVGFYVLKLKVRKQKHILFSIKLLLMFIQ